jgi:sugar O-acyltransferase (sialic acid O-acetyltransferase NeuD family)
MIPDVVADCDNIELLGFVDVADEKRFLVGNAADFPVYERSLFPAELKGKLGDFSVLVAGSIKGLRPKIIEEVEGAGLSFVNVIHPSAIIAPSARIGQDILILPGVIIGSGVTIGDHVILNSAVTIDHDSLIEDSVSIGPGVHLAGGITVRSGTFIGIAACSANGVTIGRNCLIGAGSVVTEDIPDNVVAAGVPAKVIRSRG